MAKSHTLSGESIAKLPSSSLNFSGNQLELLYQAETYMRSGDKAAALEVLYLALNLAPVFSTEFKVIRKLIHYLACPPCLNPSQNNSNDSTRGKLAVYLVAILAILVELLKIVLGNLAAAGVLSVIGYIACEISLKNEKEITCKDSIEPEKSIAF